MAYVLTQEEFEALDAVIGSSKLQNNGIYLVLTDDGTSDYFVIENKSLSFELPFEEGLAIISDSVDFDNLIELGYITENQLNTILDLFDRFDIAY